MNVIDLVSSESEGEGEGESRFGLTPAMLDDLIQIAVSGAKAASQEDEFVGLPWKKRPQAHEDEMSEELLPNLFTNVKRIREEAAAQVFKRHKAAAAESEDEDDSSSAEFGGVPYDAAALALANEQLREQKAALPENLGAAYRALRGSMLTRRGDLPTQDEIHQLRFLRQKLIERGTSPERSPERPKTPQMLTREEQAFLGQFPLWPERPYQASPELKRELFMRKKAREHEFLKRSLGLETLRLQGPATSARSAVVLIVMHGVFNTEKSTTVPAGMTVTRATFSSPGALHYGYERVCSPVDLQWEHQIIKKGLARYHTLFPQDRERINAADFLNVIERELNATCRQTYVPYFEKHPKAYMATGAFCREHVGLQYMMYRSGQPMAYKVFQRRQSRNERNFNVYVTEMNGRTYPLFPDRPLKLKTTSDEILQRLEERGFTDVVIIDTSCQSFSKVPEEQIRETARTFAEKYFLGGGGGCID